MAEIWLRDTKRKAKKILVFFVFSLFCSDFAALFFCHSCHCSTFTCAKTISFVFLNFLFGVTSTKRAAKKKVEHLWGYFCSKRAFRSTKQTEKKLKYHPMIKEKKKRVYFLHLWLGETTFAFVFTQKYPHIWFCVCFSFFVETISHHITTMFQRSVFPVSLCLPRSMPSSLFLVSRFASKLSGGSTKNGRDSNPKHLGVKIYGDQFAKAGSIIVKQRGTKYHPGGDWFRGFSAFVSLIRIVDQVVMLEWGKTTHFLPWRMAWSSSRRASTPNEPCELFLLHPASTFDFDFLFC